MARPNTLKRRAEEQDIDIELLVARAFRQGRTIASAHKVIGISYQSLWRYVDAHRDLFEQDCHWTYKGNIVDAEIVDAPTHARPADDAHE